VAGEVAWDPADQPEPTAPVRVVSPRILGILSMVFAGLTIGGTLFGSCTNYALRHIPQLEKMAGEGMEDKEAAVEAYNEFYRSTFGASMASAGIIGGMAVVLLVIGVGQLRFRRWARTWSLIWSWSALAALAVILAINFLILDPASERMSEAMARAAPSGTLNQRYYTSMAPMIGGWVTAAMNIASYAPYPLVLIRFFSRPRVKDAMNK
jgi:hypothetical protein